jgi:hypothetical protein
MCHLAQFAVRSCKVLHLFFVKSITAGMLSNKITDTEEEDIYATSGLAAKCSRAQEPDAELVC